MKETLGATISSASGQAEFTHAASRSRTSSSIMDYIRMGFDLENPLMVFVQVERRAFLDVYVLWKNLQEIITTVTKSFCTALSLQPLSCSVVAHSRSYSPP